jgi:antibiotic biosynthesis monooxygenase (ABM) superfamily enzyme
MTDNDAVTFLISRTVKPGQESAYEQLLNEFSKEAQKFPGYVGANFIRPTSKSRPEFVTILRFSSEDLLAKWQQSTPHKRLVSEIELIAKGPASMQRVSGLEVWFTPAGVTAATAPSPHKMALVLFSVVYVLSCVLIPLVNQFGSDWPIYARLLVSVGLQVGLMTYVIMPRVTRLLAPWLFRTVVVK